MTRSRHILDSKSGSEDDRGYQCPRKREYNEQSGSAETAT